MSSREIATLCDKRHDHVLRDIDNLNETYEKYPPKVGEGYAQSWARVSPKLRRPPIPMNKMDKLTKKWGMPKVGGTPYTHGQNGQTP